MTYIKRLTLVLIRGLINGITFYCLGMYLNPGKLPFFDACMLGFANIMLWHFLVEMEEKL